MKNPSGRIVKTLTRGIEHEIRAHHAADRARRANHGNLRVRLDPHLRERRRDAAREIEDQETRPRHRILDVVPEQPEEPHVPDQVHPAAMKEHRREDVEVLRPRIDHAGQAVTHLERRAGAEKARELTGNQAAVADRRGEREFAARALIEHPRHRTDRDDRERHDRRTLRLVLVVVRDHPGIVRAKRRTCPSPRWQCAIVLGPGIRPSQHHHQAGKIEQPDHPLPGEQHVADVVCAGIGERRPKTTP